MRLQIAIGGLLAAALPAGSQPPPPPTVPWAPWSVESPGPLGARFGLGVDLALDGVDQAQVVGGTQSVTTIGPDGSPRTTVAPVDVDLTNRKHRQDWEERSLGFQAPVALPPFHLGALRVEPSLVVEAAAVDGRLTFVDLVEGEPDRALDGTAARWGVGVEALGELCRGCRWFWSAGYRYRSLGSLDVDGPLPLDEPGLAVTERTEIDHDAHHLTARLGALVAGGRATAYVGARSRQSDLVIEDETTLRFPQARPDETVSTRLDLAADDTAALAGTDFRLGGGYVARVEATSGGEGESVLLKVVRAHHWRSSPSQRRPAVEERRRRAEELAGSIAPRVDELRRRFARRVQEIGEEAGPGRPLPTPAVLALLAELEADLRNVLAEPELLPILSSFLDFLHRAREGLSAPAGGAVTTRPVSPRPAPPGLAFAALPVRQDPPRPGAAPPPDSARGWLALIAEELDRLFTRADTRQLTQDICVRSLPRRPARVTLWPNALTARGGKPDLDVFQQSTENPLHVFYRGLYAYQAKLRGRTISCPTLDPSTTCALIDLWKGDGPFLTCDFRRDLEGCTLGGGDLARCGR